MFKYGFILILAGFTPTIAGAATITATAIGQSVNANDAVEARSNEVFDTDADPSGSATASAAASGGLGLAQSEASFVESGGSMSAISEAEMAAGPLASAQHADTSIVFKESYRAVGSGEVTAELRIFGQLSVLTDLDQPERYARANGSLGISAPSRNVSIGVVTSAQPDPLFLADGGMFEFTLKDTFEVEDGDLFNISATLQAVAGRTDAILGFANASARISSYFTVSSIGAEIVTGDGSVPSPVPLPASVFLLGVPLAGLFALKRRKA